LREAWKENTATLTQEVARRGMRRERREDMVCGIMKLV